MMNRVEKTFPKWALALICVGMAVVAEAEETIDETTYVETWGQDFESATGYNAQITVGPTAAVGDDDCVTAKGAGGTPNVNQVTRLNASSLNTSCFTAYKYDGTSIQSASEASTENAMPVKFDFPSSVKSLTCYVLDFDWSANENCWKGASTLAIKTSAGNSVLVKLAENKTTNPVSATVYTNGLNSTGKIINMPGRDNNPADFANRAYWHHIRLIAGESGTTVQITRLSDGADETGVLKISDAALTLDCLYGAFWEVGGGKTSYWCLDNVSVKVPMVEGQPEVTAPTFDTTEQETTMTFAPAEGATVYYRVGPDGDFTAYTEGAVSIPSSTTVYYYTTTTTGTSETASQFVVSDPADIKLNAPTRILRRGINQLYVEGADQSSVLGNPEQTIKAFVGTETYTARAAGTPALVPVTNLRTCGAVSVYATNTKYADSTTATYTAKNLAAGDYALKDSMDFTIYSGNLVICNPVETLDPDWDYTSMHITSRGSELSSTIVLNKILSGNYTRWNISNEGVKGNNSQSQFPERVLVKDVKSGDVVYFNADGYDTSKVFNWYTEDGTVKSETLVLNEDYSSGHEFYFTATHDGEVMLGMNPTTLLSGVQLYTPAALNVNGEGLASLEDVTLAVDDVVILKGATKLAQVEALLPDDTYLAANTAEGAPQGSYVVSTVAAPAGAVTAVVGTGRTVTITATEGTDIYYSTTEDGEYTKLTGNTITVATTMLYIKAGVTLMSGTMVYSTVTAVTVNGGTEVQLNKPTSICARGLNAVYVATSQDDIEPVAPTSYTIKYTIDGGTTMTADSAFITFDEKNGTKIVAWCEADGYKASESVEFAVVRPDSVKYASRAEADLIAVTRVNTSSLEMKDTQTRESASIVVDNVTKYYSLMSIQFKDESLLDSTDTFLWGMASTDSGNTSRWKNNGIKGVYTKSVSQIVLVKDCKKGDLVYVNGRKDGVLLPPCALSNDSDFAGKMASNLKASTILTGGDNETWYEVQADGDAMFAVTGTTESDANKYYPLYAVRTYSQPDYKVTFTHSNCSVYVNGSETALEDDYVETKAGTVTFTIEPDSDYVIDSVKSGDATCTPDDGVYSITVSGNMTITVATILAKIAVNGVKYGDIAKVGLKNGDIIVPLNGTTLAQIDEALPANTILVADSEESPISYTVTTVAAPSGAVTAVSGTSRTVTITSADGADVYYSTTADGEFTKLTGTTITVETEKLYIKTAKTSAGGTLVYSAVTEVAVNGGTEVQLAAPSSVRSRGLSTVYAQASQKDVLLTPVPTFHWQIGEGAEQIAASAKTSAFIDLPAVNGTTVSVWVEATGYKSSEKVTYTVQLPDSAAYAVRCEADLEAVTRTSNDGVEFSTAIAIPGIVYVKDDVTYNFDFNVMKFKNHDAFNSDILWSRDVKNNESRWQNSRDEGVNSYSTTKFIAITNCVAGDLVYLNANGVVLPPFGTDKSKNPWTDASLVDSNVVAADGFTTKEHEYWYTVQKDGPVVLGFHKDTKVYAVRTYHKWTAYERFVNDIGQASAGGTVTLVGDVTLTKTAEITKDVTIDLADYTLTGNDCRAIWVKSGAVTITGTGTITSVKPENGTLADSSSVIRVGDGAATAAIAKLTIDSGVTISAPATYGVTVFGKNTTTDTTVNPIQLVMNGTISAGGAAGISGNGSSGLSATTITVGGSVTSTVDAGIYLPGAGVCTIGASASVSGPTGIAVKGGQLVVKEGATITATGEKTAFVHNGNGWNSTGDAIAIEATPDYPANTSISVATPASYTIGTYAQPGKDVTVVGTKSSDGTTYGVQSTTAATTVPDTVTEVVIQPGATVKAESATESAGKTLAGKIVVKYGSTDLTEYMNKTVATDGTVSIALKAKTDLTTEQKAKVVPAATAMAMPQESSTDQVSFTIGNPVEGLFYSVVAADSVADLETAEVPTGTQYQGGSSMTVTSATLPSDSNVKYYKVSVKATK